MPPPLEGRAIASQTAGDYMLVRTKITRNMVLPDHMIVPSVRLHFPPPLPLMTPDKTLIGTSHSAFLPGTFWVPTLGHFLEPPFPGPAFAPSSSSVTQPGSD